MPELPEVETVRRGLEPRLVGRRIARAVARRPDLRVPLPPRFGERLAGRRIVRLGRRAKYLLVFLDDGMALMVHLGMSGRMLLQENAPPPGPHDHVIFEIDGGTRVTFNDARRFGLMDLAEAEALDRHPRLAGLGPEPLDAAFDVARLAAALAGRRAPIKAALNDQRIVAGLGNIYACESLFRAGLSPRRQAGRVTGRRLAGLVSSIKTVLTEAIAAGGATLRDHRQTTGDLGYFQHAFAVYDREGRGCPGCDCDPATSGGVRRIVQAGRATFYCPRRQR